MAKKRIHELIDRNMSIIRGDEKYDNGTAIGTNSGNIEIYNKQRPAPDIYGIQSPGAYKGYGGFYPEIGDTMRGTDGEYDVVGKTKKMNDIPETDPDLMYKNTEEEFTLESIKEEHPQVARLVALFVDRISSVGMESNDIFTILGVILESLNVKNLPDYYKKRLMKLMIKKSLKDSKE